MEKEIVMSDAHIPRILVCGGRNYNDMNNLNRTLDAICRARGWIYPEDELGNWLPRVTIISGKARGADTLAADWAIINWTGLDEYPADWNKHGKSAGYIRNREMLERGKPDLIVAFPGGKGTAMMVDIAKKAGVEVIDIATGIDPAQLPE